jgi:hypothetical protein
MGFLRLDYLNVTLRKIKVTYKQLDVTIEAFIVTFKNDLLQCIRYFYTVQIIRYGL